MTQLVVGRIVRPHGLRGEVVIEVRTDDPETRFQPGVEYTTKKGPLKAATVRWHQGRPMIGFEGVRDRNGSEALRGTVLSVEVDEEELEADEEADEFHDTLLIGMTVVERDGEAIGTVSRIQHGAAYETLVVKRKDRDPALIPFVADMIVDVDSGAETITVDLPEGLLDLDL